jgi:glucose/arabinose dehydrogenase
MHRLIIILIVILLLGGGVWYIVNNREKFENKYIQSIQEVDSGMLKMDPSQLKKTIQNGDESSHTSQSNTEKVTIIAQNLDTPWAMEFLPDDSLLFTERKGSVRMIGPAGQLKPKPVADLQQVKEVGEGGLLGIVAHPDFLHNSFIYLYYTYQSEGNDTMNRVSRFIFTNGMLSDEKTIVDAIPGNANHNGGRIKFGPDNFLYIGTGDAEVPSRAQDTNSLAGKILRVTENGDPAAGNPFNNRVYSYGHRNVQGLAWDKDGQLFATEHGPSGTSSCCDEVNKIEIGKNYGWPTIKDTQDKEGMETPLKSSGKDTWAPSGMGYRGGSMYFAGLRGQSLYKITLNGASILDFKQYLKGEYGRLRDVVVGPDGMLYVTTSNQDGRGTPKSEDDKILRINTSKL